MPKSKEVKQLREVRIIDLFLYFGLPIILLIIIWLVFILNLINDWFNLNICLLVLIFIALSYLPIRFLAIGTILMYKAFAPLDVRGRCLYQPTCSTYMLISIKKYGLLLGITLGLKRIRRCHPPNGGYDYPSLKSLFSKNNK